MADELKLVFKAIDNPSSLDIFSRDIEIYFDEDKIRSKREEDLLKETIKDAKKSRTKIYTLSDEGTDKVVGLISLSASRLDEKPALVIDYIFVTNKFRFKKSEFSYAQLLISFALNKGLELQKKIGLSNLILYPDGENKKLIEYYKKYYDFQEIRQRIVIQNKPQNERWLFLRLKKK